MKRAPSGRPGGRPRRAPPRRSGSARSPTRAARSGGTARTPCPRRPRRRGRRARCRRRGPGRVGGEGVERARAAGGNQRHAGARARSSSWPSTQAPAQCSPSEISSITAACSSTRMCGRSRTRSISGSAIAAPVALPPACRIRRRLWPPSRPSADGRRRRGRSTRPAAAGRRFAVALADQHPHGVAVAEPASHPQRVLEVPPGDRRRRRSRRRCRPGRRTSSTRAASPWSPAPPRRPWAAAWMAAYSPASPAPATSRSGVLWRSRGHGAEI